MVLISIWNVVERNIGRNIGQNLTYNAFIEIQWYIFQKEYLECC